MTAVFDLQPVLVGTLLTCRPLRRDDCDSLYQIAADPLIWEQHPQPTRYQRPVFEQYFEGAMRSGGALAVLHRTTGEPIGCSRYYDLAADRSQIIIGYTFLARKYWGGEYNRELKQLMLAHAFRFVDTVVFEIGVSNHRSRRAIEKIGAILKREQSHDGSMHAIYQIHRHDFLPLHKPNGEPP